MNFCDEIQELNWILCKEGEIIFVVGERARSGSDFPQSSSDWRGGEAYEAIILTEANMCQVLLGW